ncbi:acriflavine resistance protein B [Campylobacterota bacterium]|nr:acriflavine resistance protein B [Campylobacterota bacterium]
MDIIKFSISKPVAVTVCLILITLFGVISLTRLPYQLTPNVNRPEISVMTRWSGASPYEVESEIVEPQEKVLKNIENLEEYESTSGTGVGRITLRFKLGSDIQKALLDTSNKLSEVRSYPDNVEKPVLRATGETVPPAVWMMAQTLEENSRDIATYQTFLEDEITGRFERIEGVSELFLRGGIADEIHIIIDPMRLAALGLTIDRVIEAVQRLNTDISAGTLDLGRRSYRVRTVGKFESPEAVGETVLFADGHKQVLLKEIATIEAASAKKTGIGIFRGKSGISLGVRPEAGANIVEMTDRIESTMQQLNETILKDNGIEIVWNYDQRPYILGAISLMKQNIVFGGILAVFVLLIFLRSITPTLVVAIAIPLSVFGAFIVLGAMGRSLNIISLAGISFAVGMLVDSAIIVLENIDRHKQMGKPIASAAYDGAVEVWGALVISALTTVAVFAPIIFLSDEAGQLFKDIAIAVTAAILFSLFISVLAIPMLWRQMTRVSAVKKSSSIFSKKLGELGAFLSRIFMSLMSLTIKNHITRFGTVGTFTFLSIAAIYFMFPKMEYLPEGNRNLVQNMFIMPPGLSFEEIKAIGFTIFEKIKPNLEKEIDGFPQIDRAFFNAGGSWMFMGVSTIDEERASELIPLFRPIVNSFPGVSAVTKQAGVFESGMGASRSINVDITAETLDEITEYAAKMMNAIKSGIDGAQVRPVPSLEIIYPEVTITPRGDRLKAVGMDARSLGIAADVLLDGRKISEYQGGGIKKIDLILMTRESDIRSPEDLQRSLVATPNGQVLPLNELGDVQLGYGVTEIRHYEGGRTITLQVSPPRNITIQEVMEKIDDEIKPQVLGDNDRVGVRLSGTADKLTATVLALKWNFILAVVITYLLMSALFGNFIYPFIILFTVPLATAGGFLGLKMTNIFIAPQPLDILTMLGFIILVGIVVNNAILIVHQSLNFIRNDKMAHIEAIREAVRTRLRPIYMSTLTSVFGMLPLVLVPGPGSEMYRGLGSVITSGLMVSTIFTIFVIPPLLSYAIKWEKL